MDSGCCFFILGNCNCICVFDPDNFSDKVATKQLFCQFNFQHDLKKGLFLPRWKLIFNSSLVMKLRKKGKYYFYFYLVVMTVLMAGKAINTFENYQTNFYFYSIGLRCYQRDYQIWACYWPSWCKCFYESWSSEWIQSPTKCVHYRNNSFSFFVSVNN